MVSENIVPNKPVASVIPAGVASVDANTGIVHDIGACKYTPIGTIGTNTVNANPCVFYAVAETGTGTSWVATVLDGTSTLAVGTLSAGALVQGGPAGLGIRCNTSLIVVTTGTAGSGNVLWD